MKTLILTGLLCCGLWSGGLYGQAPGHRHEHNPGHNHGQGESCPCHHTEAARQIYEWRIYTLKAGANAAVLDDFFRDQLIPAYNRHHIEVGAFELAQPYPDAEAGARYLFIAYPDIETFQRVSRAVREDADFMTSAQGYFNASAPDPIYTNLETYLCEAFDSIPQLRRPDAGRGLFEFRIYRSPNMEANERKIRMFQSGEIDIFNEVGINSVCYGRTLAGSRAPSLTYLTWYKDMETRNEAWRKFQAHPEWRRMRALPEYAHTATNNVARLLTPLPYSQF